MIEVYSGEDREAAERTILARELLMDAGFALRIIPLNGGSQTRRESREYWFALARARCLPYRAFAFQIVIGGRHKRGAGWRYLSTEREGGWIHWRKAKRLARETEKKP